MRYKFLLIGLFMVIASGIFAQQDPLFTNYLFNSYVLNPATAGNKGGIDAVMAIRSQWAGFDAAPKTQSISINSPINNRRIGLGASFVNDKLGANRLTGLRTSGAYRFQLRKRQRNIGKLAIGLRLGFLKYGVNWSELKTTDPDDQIVLLGRSTNKLTVPDLGLGMYFEADNYYAGFSFSHLIPTKVDFTQGQSIDVNETSRIYYHFLLTAGYLHELQDGVKIKPSILVKSVKGAPIQVDLSTSAMYKDRVRFGLTYRSGAAIAIMTEFWIKRQLRIGYAIDIPTSNLMMHSTGSHEFVVAYQFFLKRTKKQILNSRYYF